MATKQGETLVGDIARRQAVTNLKRSLEESAEASLGHKINKAVAMGWSPEEVDS